MSLSTLAERKQIACLPRESLRQLQLEKLNALLAAVLPENKFYSQKFQGLSLPLKSLGDFSQLSLTTKEELIPGEGDFAANRTWPLDRYVHFHRTSGTKGRPLIVLDCREDWQWWLDGWQYVLDAADISQQDIAVTAFSYGPFIGFWSAHDAAIARGVLVAPSGGMSSSARLDLIRDVKATLLFCTPSYALHLAETAAAAGLQPAKWSVRKIIVAGEPGGSLPAVRERIETAFGATVIDHSGATEIGPWGFGDAAGTGLFINERDFFAEFLDPQTGQPAGEGELAELVITTLGRAGSPVFRYRTGDLVRPGSAPAGQCHFTFLAGGVLGRADDMLIIRGVNIFPSSIEQILREFPEVAEFRLTAFKQGAMDALSIEVEDSLNQPQRIARQLQNRLGLRVEVTCVPENTLPRFEAKAKRLLDQRE